jgi:hypothetical protein
LLTRQAKQAKPLCPGAKAGARIDAGASGSRQIRRSDPIRGDMIRNVIAVAGHLNKDGAPHG